MAVACAYHALVSEPGPFDDNPFGGLPFFGDLARMFSGQGPISWDTARQTALVVATEGKPEPNIDPAVRFAFADLARVAELHVQQALGLDTAVGGRAVEVLPVTPGVWAARTLDAYRPLFEHLAGALGRSTPTAAPEEVAGDEDDVAGMMGQLFTMLHPMLLGLSAGGMVGHLARRSFGQYDLPIPRPPSHELLVLPASIDAFAADWSLPVDDLRLWVCLQELATHAVLGVPHVRAALETMLTEYVGGFRPDPDALAERLGSVDPMAGDPMGDLQRALGDPEVLLGAMRSPEQEALRPRLDALVALVVGVVDHTVDRSASVALGSAGQMAEAVRRRRVEADQADVFVEHLLGLTLTREQVERGHAFVDGVIERAGTDGLARLWASARALPTPAELDAPGLWLARLDLPEQ